MHLKKEDNLAKDTREVMHKIHLGQMNTPNARNRMEGLHNTESLRLNKDYFKDKVCIDIGCGSAAVGTVNLLNLGAKFVHLCDVDDSFIEPASKILNATPEFDNRWEAKIGNALSLPYENESFDFAICQGVLHHIADDKDALKEIYRILTPEGKAHLSIVGYGGLIGNFVMRTMREEYRENEAFKSFIDGNLDVESFKSVIDYLKSLLKDDQSEEYKNSINLLTSISNLIDKDLILTLEDRIHAPLYRQTKEKDFHSKVIEQGFKTCQRISTTPKYKNIRKVVEALYTDYENDLAKIFFGDGGTMSFIVSK